MAETESLLDKYDSTRERNLVQSKKRTNFQLGDDRSQLRKGLAAGVQQTQALAFGAGAAIADSVGATDLAEAGIAGYQRNMQEASYHEGNVPTVSGVSSWGDFGDWAAYEIGRSIPTLATIIGSGGFVGAGGQIAARTGARQLLTKQIKSRAEKKIAAGMAAGMAKREAADEIVDASVKAGGIAGFTLPSVALSSGEIVGRIEEETGEIRGGTAIAFGMISGALDAAPIMRLGKVANMSQGQVKAGVMGKIKDAGWAALAQAGAEGATEAAQAVVEQAAVDWVDEHMDLFSADMLRQMAESGASGALMGSIMGGTTRAASDFAQTFKQAEEDLKTATDPKSETFREPQVKLLEEQSKRSIAETLETAKTRAMQGDQSAIPEAKAAIAKQERELNDFKRRWDEAQAWRKESKKSDGAKSGTGNAGSTSTGRGSADSGVRTNPESGESLRVGGENLSKGPGNSGVVSAPRRASPVADADAGQPDGGQSQANEESQFTKSEGQAEQAVALRQAIKSNETPEVVVANNQKPWRKPAIAERQLKKNGLESIYEVAATQGGYALKLIGERNAAENRDTGRTETQSDLSSLDSAAESTARTDQETTGATIDEAGSVNSALDEAANEAATSPTNDRPEPTDAQKEAGNYKLGQHKFDDGLDVAIENPKGSTRSGTARSGEKWSIEMQDHYGYVKATEAVDGDAVDVFMGDRAEDTTLPVYIVDQVDPKTGKYDEPKVMIGYDDLPHAEQAYQRNYAKGWKGLGAITPMSRVDFKEWVKSDAAKKPVGDISRPVKPQTGQSAKKLTPKQRAAQRRVIDPAKDDLLTAISKLGGLATDVENDFKGRLKHIKTPVGMPGLERPQEKGGQTLDYLAERLIEEGYLLPTDIGNGVDQSTLADKIDLAAAGNSIMSLQVEEQSLADEFYAENLEQAERELTEVTHQLVEAGLPLDTALKTIKDMANAGDPTDQIISELRELAEDMQSNGKETEQASAESSEPSSGSSQEGFLESYTEEDIARREEEARVQRGEEQERLSRAEQQDTADDFVLSGSNSDADQAAARGQEDLLASVNESTGQAEPIAKEDAPSSKTPDEKIEDFGGKIGGARKDVFGIYGTQLAASTDVAALPISKSFPAPNYEKMEVDGAKREVLAYVALLRANLGSKPKRPHKLKMWVRDVEEARAEAARAIEEGFTSDNIIQFASSLTEAMASVPAKHYAAISKFDFRYSQGSMNIDGEMVPKEWVRVASIGGRRAFPDISRATAGDTPAEVSKKFKKILENWAEEQAADKSSKAVEGGKAKPKEKKIAIYRRHKTGEYFLSHKTAGGEFILRDGIASVTEARRIHTEENDAMQKEIIEKRKAPILRNAANEPREGVTKTDGDIKPEVFQETYDFFGVEFGNYVEGPKRQKDLNEAFEALADLSDALSIEPKALSLNGSLGLAFGARGTGSGGVAHYERDHIAINLTKRSGAGSLAHEWLHGMDNYFARQGEGLKGRDISLLMMTDIAGDHRKPKPEGIRQEVFDAFRGVTDAIRTSEFNIRSKDLDAGRSKKYYGTMVEMAARSFEKFIVQSLKKKNIRNDYLANINESDGAYPTDAEMDGGIGKAYQKLFDTIETQQTDEGTAMFSKALGAVRNGMPKSKIQGVVNRVSKNQPNFPDVVIVQRSQEIPGVGVLAQDGVRGVFDPTTNKVYLVAGQLDDALTVEQTLLHEVQHYSSRRAYGKSAMLKLNKIADAIDRAGGVAQFANDNNLNYDHAWYQGVFEQQGTSKTEQRERHVDEMLAELAESRATTLGKIKLLAKQAIGAIRRWLRAQGFPLTAKLPIDEMMLVLNETQGVLNQDNASPRALGSAASSSVNPDVMFSKPLDDAKSKATALISRSSPGIKRFVKRNFTKEGLLNKETFARKIEKDAMQNVGEADVAALVHDLDEAMEKAYKVKRYSQLKAADLEQVNRYLAGETGARVPDSAKPTLDGLRSHLDRLSGEMINSLLEIIDIDKKGLSEKQQEQFELFQGTDGEEGSIPPRLQKNINTVETIRNNIGSYLNRSYQAFDDAKWKDKVLANDDLMQRAEAYIRERNPDFSQREVTGAVRAILQSAKKNGNFLSFIGNGSKVGSKDVSMLKKRKEVPPIIRELLGEYKDPKINFARSASKMHFMVANHEFLMSVRKDGLDTFLFEQPTGEFDDQIAGEDSDTMNPLNGLYTTEDFRQGMEDAVGGFEGSDLMRNIIFMNSMVKYGKTILSPTTQMRNFQSAAMFTVMNGHFKWGHMSKAFSVAKSDMFTKDEKWREYLNDLIGLGVLHDNPYAGELKDAIKDFTEVDHFGTGASANLKRGADFMQRLYGLGDDFWKIVGFENELQSGLDAGLTLDEAREQAATRIRDGYPTYSQVPRAIKLVRRWPLIGTFVSFPYEAIRTTYNQVGFVRDDLATGNKKAAHRRMLGMALATASAAAVSKLSMVMMGITDEDDEAVRNLMPPWSKNSQLAYLGYDKDGLPMYLDLSYLDPYTYLKRPFTAMLNGNNRSIGAKVTDAINEMASPFIGTDIAAGAIGEIVFNKRLGGGQVYNEADTGWRKATAIADHARKAVQPGILSNIERTIMAIQGEVSRSGREYTLANEGLGWLGHRVSTINVRQSLIYKAYEFNDTIRQSSSIISRIAGSQQKMTDGDIRAAYESAKQAREKAFSEMTRLIQGAQRLGVKPNEAGASLRVARISKANVSAIIAGEVPKYKVSSRFTKSAEERAIVSASNPERKAELAREMARRREVLRRIIEEDSNSAE